MYVCMSIHIYITSINVNYIDTSGCSSTGLANVSAKVLVSVSGLPVHLEVLKLFKFLAPTGALGVTFSVCPSVRM